MDALPMGILFLQWYTGAMLLGDLFTLCRLWGPSLRDGSAALVGASAPRLSQGTMWFDKASDSPLGAAVFTFVVLFLALPRLFALLQPVNRWLLLNAALLETVRLVLFSLLYSVNDAATSANTMMLVFLGWNSFFYWHAWYTTMCMILRAMKS